MTLPDTDLALDAIRRDIDQIDDGLLELMIRRLAATARVRSSKQSDGSINASPLRPAREAQMLRRLVAEGQGRIAPQLVVRLWRVILSSSIQEQAPVVLHVENALAEDIEARVELASHFCGFRVRVHGSLEQALSALSTSRADLVAARTDSAWADSLGGGGVVGALPILGQGAVPGLIILGHAAPLPSGDDQTIVLSSSPLPVETQAPRWQCRSGAWYVACLAGFDVPLPVPMPDQIIRIAGRYPSPLEVSP